MTRNETPPDQGGPGQWIKSNLSALGSATVFAVYAAGFVKTRAAAESFSDQPVRRVRTVSVAPPTDAPATSVVTPPTASQPAAAPTPDKGAAPAQAAVPSVSASVSKQVATPAASAPATSRDTARTPVTTPSSVPAATVVASAPPPVAAPVAAAVVASAAPAPVVQTPVAASTPAPTPAPAPTPVPVTPAPVAAAAPTAAASKRVGFKDGSYVGYGKSRHGDIEVGVDVIDGQIVAAYITDCKTEYSCSWIVNLPPEVVKRQSAEVDIVSGATASSDAFYAAVVAALNKAK